MHCDWCKIQYVDFRFKFFLSDKYEILIPFITQSGWLATSAFKAIMCCGRHAALFGSFQLDNKNIFKKQMEHYILRHKKGTCEAVQKKRANTPFLGFHDTMQGLIQTNKACDKI